MTLTRRQTIDACREGPALFSGLPGNEIDLERLTEFAAARGLDAAIHVIDGTLEGILWLKGGAPGEAWFLEADGGETIVPIEPEQELLRDIAASGTVSCYIASPEAATGTASRPASSASAGARTETRRRPPAPAASAREVAGVADIPLPNVLRDTPAATSDDRATAVDGRPADGSPGDERSSHRASETTAPSPAREGTGGRGGSTTGSEPAAVVAPPAVAPPAVARPASAPAPPEVREPEEPAWRIAPQPAPSKPWPAILIEVRARVAKHRGKRLAERFIGALGKALEAHGGRVDQDRVIAPPLSDEQWEGVIDAACGPVVAVAGRAWTNRTFHAAEQTVLAREGWA
jgi:hypothetical protein